MKAYLEMNVAPGKLEGVLRELRRIKALREASAVTGHCDVIASIDVHDMETLSKLLTQTVHHLDGVTRTETLVCVTVE